MTARLSDCAEVRSGLVLSRKIAHKKSANRYPLLNLKSVNDNATVNLRTLDVFDAAEPLSAEYVTQEDDIIVRMSSPYTAVLIDAVTAGMVVSSNFVIIRCDGWQLLPSYLFWYLNTAAVKKDIRANSARNMLSAIRPQYFAALKLPLIPLEKQRLIADFHRAARKETALLERLCAEKEKYYQAQLEKLNKIAIQEMSEEEHTSSNQKEQNYDDKK